MRDGPAPRRRATVAGVSDSADVGIVGGTGPAGRGLAARLADAGMSVTIGSRSPERAAATCTEIEAAWPERSLALRGASNSEASQARLVIVATPWKAASVTTAELAENLGGKVVVSMANALERVDGEFHAVIPPLGSVAAAVASAAPGALVTAAFHHLPARSLAELARPVEGDVLISADSDEAADATAALVSRIPDLRPVRAGSLATAAAVEAFTAVLLGVNAHYRARSAIRLLGLGNPPGAGK